MKKSLSKFMIHNKTILFNNQLFPVFGTLMSFPMQAQINMKFLKSQTRELSTGFQSLLEYQVYMVQIILFGICR